MRVVHTNMGVPDLKYHHEEKVEPPRLRMALLCDFASDTAGTILDHINGIRDLSHHEVTLVNFRGELPKATNLDQFDGLLIHYSLVACYDSYISPLTRIKIRNFQGVKIAFVQDDYRFIDNTVEAMVAMRINGLLGLAGQDIIDDVYSPKKLPGVRRETVLTGYVPEHLLKIEVPKYQDRPIDIGYRARKLPAWLGSHGQEKWIVADKFIKTAGKYNLVSDISWQESDRIYGGDWLKFVSNCKAMIGAESGSGVCDFTGEIQDKVEAHLDRDPDATFAELRELYFKEEDGRLLMNVISPRCFEAAAMRTLMIMYEGDYSGCLVAGRHYVVLDRDHGNMDEVIAILQDPEKAQKIIDNAYDEVALNPANKFSAMVEFLDEVIAERNAYLGVRKKLTSKKRSQSWFRFFPIRTLIAHNWQAKLVDFKPFILRNIHRVLNFLPEPVSKKIFSYLRSLYRRFIKREKKVTIYMPMLAVFWSLFITKRYKIFMEIFGKDVVIKHPVFFVMALDSVFHMLEMVATVSMADGVANIMAYDRDTQTLVLRAYNSDFPVELGTLRPIHINELVREVEQGSIVPKKIVWSPIGLGGVSRSLPFEGECEFSNLEWGLKNYCVELIQLLHAELSNKYFTDLKSGQSAKI